MISQINPCQNATKLNKFPASDHYLIHAHARYATAGLRRRSKFTLSHMYEGSRSSIGDREKGRPGNAEAAPAKSLEEVRKQQGRFCSQITIIK